MAQSFTTAESNLLRGGRIALSAMGKGGHGDVDEPLPRDGETVSRAVDDGRGLRVVKHDVEGHAIAAALKRRGLLEEALLASLV